MYCFLHSDRGGRVRYQLHDGLPVRPSGADCVRTYRVSGSWVRTGFVVGRCAGCLAAFFLQSYLRARGCVLRVGAPAVCAVHEKKQEDDHIPAEEVSSEISCG